MRVWVCLRVSFSVEVVLTLEDTDSFFFTCVGESFDVFQHTVSAYAFLPQDSQRGLTFVVAVAVLTEELEDT